MAKVTIKKDGPLVVEGVEEVTLHNGATLRSEKKGLVLCRCGHSNTKPLCDGNHRYHTFDNGENTGKVSQSSYSGPSESVHYNSNNVPLVIAEKNGPFITYNCDVVFAGEGKVNGDKPSLRLCRCGKSNNKPYCDDAHLKFDWQDSND